MDFVGDLFLLLPAWVTAVLVVALNAVVLALAIDLSGVWLVDALLIALILAIALRYAGAWMIARSARRHAVLWEHYPEKTLRGGEPMDWRDVLSGAGAALLGVDALAVARWLHAEGLGGGIVIGAAAFGLLACVATGAAVWHAMRVPPVPAA